MSYDSELEIKVLGIPEISNHLFLYFLTFSNDPCCLHRYTNIKTPLYSWKQRQTSRTAFEVSKLGFWLFSFSEKGRCCIHIMAPLPEIFNSF